MKTREEVLREIERIEATYTPDNIPEYVRGQYVVLKWFLEETVY